MKSTRVIDEIYIPQCLECLAVNAKVATVLRSIPASSDTVKFEGRQMKQCRITYIKNPKNPPLKERDGYVLLGGVGPVLPVGVGKVFLTVGLIRLAISTLNRARICTRLRSPRT
jgi:hypothetical protein